MKLEQVVNEFKDNLIVFNKKCSQKEQEKLEKIKKNNIIYNDIISLITSLSEKNSFKFFNMQNSLIIEFNYLDSITNHETILFQKFKIEVDSYQVIIKPLSCILDYSYLILDGKFYKRSVNYIYVENTADISFNSLEEFVEDFLISLIKETEKQLK